MSNTTNTNTTATSKTEDLQDVVSKALRRAWQLGQTYWQQADSDSYRQNKQSGETQAVFVKLVDETRAALATPAQAAALVSPSDDGFMAAVNEMDGLYAAPAQAVPASVIMASVMCDDGGEHAAAKKHPCPVCGKRLRLVGMQDHIRDAHALG